MEYIYQGLRYELPELPELRALPTPPPISYAEGYTADQMMEYAVMAIRGGLKNTGSAEF